MKKNLNNIIKQHDKNGIIKTKDISNSGLHRSVLNELVDCGKYKKVARGIYHRQDLWEDEFYIFQQRYKNAIFSHATALYLYEYTDRVPTKMHITLPQGYNYKSLKESNVRITKVIKENYELGITEIKTPFGNTVKVYEIERCLCDMVRGKGGDIQIVLEAMKRYAKSKDRNINKLMRYARKLRVESKVGKYMEVLL